MKQVGTNRKSKAIKEGLRRARQRGRLPGPKSKVSDEAIRRTLDCGLTNQEAAQAAGLSVSQYIVRRRRLEAQT